MATHTLSVTHIAIRVTHLEEAENYYIKLFGLAVGFREAETPDGWCALPDGKTWADAKTAGIELALSVLYRGTLVLALDAQKDVSGKGTLSHIGLHVDESEMQRLRLSASDLDCTLTMDYPSVIGIVDRYGILWECSTFSYVNETTSKPRSSGDSAGRWLTV